MTQREAPPVTRRRRKRPQSRSQQRGSAYGALDGLLIIAAGVALIVLVLILWGYALAIARSRGVVRWVVIPLVTAGWVIPVWMWYSDGVADRAARRAADARFSAAVEACRAEAAGLNFTVRAEGLFDEGPGIGREALQHLLGPSGLNFVESRIDDQARKVFSGGQWASLRRITLSRDGDPDCEPAHSVDRSWDRRHFRLPPFLPDTCLAESFPREPVASVSLVLTGQDPGKGEFQRWQLVERSSNRILASLPTSANSDKRVVAADDGEFPPRDRNGNLSCDNPRSILTALLKGEGGAGASQRVGMQGTAVQTEPMAIQSDVEVSADLKVEQVPVADLEAVDGHDTGDEGLMRWRRAVDAAKINGFGEFGPWRLDWPTRRLERLTFEDDKITHGIWIFQAAHNGFHMWSFWNADKRDPLLAFYGRDGRLHWAVRVKSMSQTEADECHWDNPGRLSLSTDALTLVGVGRCGEARQRRKLIWTIDTRQLPT